jgi:mono/diheme cytochrome c family protein
MNANSILNGCNGMPWFSGLPSDRKVADVVAYIRIHSGNKYKYVLNPADIAFMRQNLTQAVE